jgi:hypothetical protein
MTTIAASTIPTIGATIGATLPSAGEALITDTDHPDLITMYTGDNRSGTTLADESPNGNDATIVGTVPAISGHIGNALQFPGTMGNQVDLPDVFMGTGDYSICLWVDLNTLKIDGRIFGIGQGGTPGARNIKLMFRQVNIDDIRLDIATGATTFTQIEKLGGAQLDGYHLFIIQGTPTTTEVFKDDVSIITGSSLDTSRASTQTSFGADRNENGTVNAHFDGDQIRAFNRQLTSDERTALFNGGVGA